MATTYAYKSIVGSFSDPDVGVYPFAGQEGIKHVTIGSATDRTAHDTASDGTVMVSYVSGASGYAEFECQQNSSLNQFLVNWANAKFTESEGGGAQFFAAASIKIVDLLSGANHTLTGVSPLKIPDKPYGPSGASVTWRLMAANVVTQ
jgi:Protein of unknown function (DUF3277)